MGVSLAVRLRVCRWDLIHSHLLCYGQSLLGSVQCPEQEYNPVFVALLRAVSVYVCVACEWDFTLMCPFVTV